MKKLKKFIFIFCSCTAMFFMSPFFNTNTAYVHANTSASPAGRTGSPGDGNLTCANTCHTGAPVQNINAVISSNIPSNGYIPGTTYTITATFNKPGHTKLGFEISPQTISGTQVGTLIAGPGTVLVGSGKYISHNSSGTSAPGGNKTWIFQWQAPAAGTGNFSFYGAFNATNSLNNTSGDSIFVSSLSVIEDPSVNVKEITENYFEVFPNPAQNNFVIRINKSTELINFRLKIYDENSKQVFDKILSEVVITLGEFNLNVEELHLHSGMYYIQVENGHSKSIIKKLLIF